MTDAPTKCAQRVQIINAKGLHARASAKLSKLAANYQAKITVCHDDVCANTNSIMDLLLLVAHNGTTIEITAEGADAAEAVTAIASLIANGFGELDDKPAC